MTHPAQSFKPDLPQPDLPQSDSPLSMASARFHSVARQAGLLVLVVGMGLAMVSLTTQAQPVAPGTTQTRFSVSGLTQFKTDLDQGGDFNWSGFNAGFGVNRQFSSALNLGVNVKYGYENWSWSDPAAFGGQAPWGSISTPGVGLSMTYAPSSSVQLGIRPSIEWAAEDGVGTASSAIYGAVFSATNTFSNDLTLGLGAGVFRELGENRVFPFLAVNWKINDDWTLKNPLPTGPAGGAGLELAYELNPRWTLSAGGAYRNYRFRLNDSGPYAGGIGQHRLIPVFARVKYSLTPATSIDFYAVASAGGKVQVENADGAQTLNTGYDTGIGLAINLSHRF